jgi:hypothetical protein
MSHIDAPALLVYKGGDVLSTIVDIPQHIRDAEITSTGIENLLKQYVSFSGLFGFTPLTVTRNRVL